MKTPSKTPTRTSTRLKKQAPIQTDGMFMLLP